VKRSFCLVLRAWLHGLAPLIRSMCESPLSAPTRPCHVPTPFPRCQSDPKTGQRKPPTRHKTTTMSRTGPTPTRPPPVPHLRIPVIAAAPAPTPRRSAAGTQVKSARAVNRASESIPSPHHQERTTRRERSIRSPWTWLHHLPLLLCTYLACAAGRARSISRGRDLCVDSVSPTLRRRRSAV
jgi:hypothetical protein